LPTEKELARELEREQRLLEDRLPDQRARKTPAKAKRT
jgi:hypothetical protein